MTLDSNYFAKKIKIILRDIKDYQSDELARELLRLGRTADDSVLSEPEFAPTAKDVGTAALDFDLAIKVLRTSPLGAELLNDAQARAAEFIFNLKHGIHNTEVAEKHSGATIFNAALLCGGLTINLDGIEYDLETHPLSLAEDDAMGMLQELADSIHDASLRAVVSGQKSAAHDAKRKPETDSSLSL